MADTIDCVFWSLDSGPRQTFWLPAGCECPDDEIDKAVKRTGLKGPLSAAFQRTKPLWYGLWIQSPLSSQQCSLLLKLFSDVVAHVPRYGEYTNAFLDGLRTGQSGGVLSVEMSAPGHVDLGFVTTFVHCPRCKAEGPFKQWQSSYPSKPIRCPVCGHTYSPAETYHMERDYLVSKIVCGDCRSEFRPQDMSNDDYQNIENVLLRREFLEEFAWLKRVAAFYERYPGQEGRFKPHFLRVMESNDPDVRSRLHAGVPFSEIEMPDEVDPAEWSAEDRSVADYLRHHSFSLEARRQFVQETVHRWEAEPPAVVNCPHCCGILQPDA